MGSLLSHPIASAGGDKLQHYGNTFLPDSSADDKIMQYPSPSL